MKKPLPKEVTEDFWNDCYENQDSKLINELLQKKNYSGYYGRNNNIKKKIKNNKNYSINIKSHNNKKKANNSSNKINNKTEDNPNLSKIYKNHQILKDTIEIQKADKDLELKRKNAMMRCLGLYAYGVEVKKAKLLNDENNKKEKVKDEMSQCTFKPKIGKYSQAVQSKYNPELNYKNNNNNIISNSNGDYKINNTNTNTNTIENGVTKKNVKNLKNNNIKKKINNYDDEDSDDLEECTFKPKISKKNIKRVFAKSKSLANEKDIAEFILRYNKAREEYMIKKIKKLSSKDYSYDMTLFSLANRLNNKNNKNGVNDIYDEKFPKNKKRNMSMNDYKDYSVDNKRQITIEPNIINSLRNDLLDIDLNEEE